MTATVRVRLFAVLRERAGRDSLTLELPKDATVADALTALADEPGLGELLGRMPLGTAVNSEYVPIEAPLRAGDELALIPPLSGGAQAQPEQAMPDQPAQAQQPPQSPPRQAQQPPQAV